MIHGLLHNLQHVLVCIVIKYVMLRHASLNVFVHRARKIHEPHNRQLLDINSTENQHILMANIYVCLL